MDYYKLIRMIILFILQCYFFLHFSRNMNKNFVSFNYNYRQVKLLYKAKKITIVSEKNNNDAHKINLSFCANESKDFYSFILSSSHSFLDNKVLQPCF